MSIVARVERRRCWLNCGAGSSERAGSSNEGHTLHFLDEQLRASDHGERFMSTTAESHGAPRGLMTIERLQ